MVEVSLVSEDFSNFNSINSGIAVVVVVVVVVVVEEVVVREAPLKLSPGSKGHCPNSDCTPRQPGTLGHFIFGPN